MKTDINIERGFGEHEREHVAGLYDEAFGAKLGFALPDRRTRLRVLAACFRPAFAYVARSEGRIIGLAGFCTRAGSLTGGLDLRLLRHELGWADALRAMVPLALLDRPVKQGQLLMDGIAVDAAARGGGVGTRLLRRIKAHAMENGLATIRLDVIDTNPGARRLYEREGFTAESTVSAGVLGRWLGFGFATTMIWSNASG